MEHPHQTGPDEGCGGCLSLILLLLLVWAVAQCTANENHVNHHHEQMGETHG